MTSLKLNIIIISTYLLIRLLERDVVTYITGRKRRKEAKTNGKGSTQHEEQDTTPERETRPNEERTNGIQDGAKESASCAQVSSISWPNISCKEGH